MRTGHGPRMALAVVLTASTASAVMGTGGPAWADSGRVDPATMHRGPDATVAYLVGDTIRDGRRSVPGTTAGDHVDLWKTAHGYVVDDWLPSRGLYRLVSVSRTGQRHVLARSAQPAGVAVSPSGRHIALGQARGGGPATRVTVADPDTGRVLAQRSFGRAWVFGVSRSRVLLTLRGTSTPETTWWWNYRRDTLSRLSGDPARRADLRHDRVVLATGPENSFCMRVARLSAPATTLWRSCRIAPQRWSPNGRRALATHTYFDESGTDRWVTVRDPTGARTGRVTGRLDWDATWEDDGHVVTLAQHGGRAAVIRCTAAGRCERASRLWRVPWHGYPPFYLAPPVVLSSN